MINFYKIAILLSLFVSDFVFSNGNLIDGKWSSETYFENKSTPYSTLELNLKIDSDNKVNGELCSISSYGNRINCQIVFYSILKNNKILFDFEDDTSGEKGNALIEFKNCIINWTLIKAPNSEFRIEKKTVLFPDSIVINKFFPSCLKMGGNYIVQNKSYLFNSPSKEKRTQMYLIKGDEVNLLQYQKGFYEVEFTTEKNKIIKKWLYCSAIDACE